MKKKFLVFILLIVVLMVSFACHGTKATEVEKEKATFTVPSEFDETREYEIEFLMKNDGFRTQKEEMEKTIARFNEYYPNIHIKISNKSDYNIVYQTIITNIPTNTTPNVCVVYPDYIATFNEGDNIVVPLDNLLSDSNYGLGGSEIKYPAIQREDLFENYLNELVIDNTQYGIPFMRSSEALYINKTMYDELGLTMPDEFTWDDLWEACRVAKAKHPEKNFIPFIYKSTDNMFIQLARQMGINYTNDDGDILLFNDDTKALLLDLQKKYQEGLYDTFKNVSYPGESMNEGNTLLCIDSTAGATWIGTYCTSSDHDGEKIEYETVVKRVPQVDLSNPQMISQGPSVCIFNKDDPQVVLASWIFAQYLLNEETQVNYSQSEGYIPVNKKAIESTSYQEYINNPNSKPITKQEKVYYDVKINASKLIIDNIDNTFITPVFNGSSMVRKASGDLIERVVYDVLTKNTKLNDSDYIDGVYSIVIEQNKLEIDTHKISKELPAGSKALIIGLVVVWFALGGIYVFNFVKNKKNNANIGKNKNNK